MGISSQGQGTITPFLSYKFLCYDPFTGSMTSDLVELNFENLVSFYCDELRRIEQGERAPDVLSQYVRGRLRDAGVLLYRNKEWSLSEKAKQLLDTK